LSWGSGLDAAGASAERVRKLVEAIHATDPVGREGSENADWLRVEISPDPSDPKLAHLDGLNLSRAWMLKEFFQRCLMTIRAGRIASRGGCASSPGLRGGNGRTLRRWTLLGGFRVYLTTQRGPSRQALTATAVCEVTNAV